MGKPRKLYLLPVPISDSATVSGIPQTNIDTMAQLEYFIAEDARTARRNLKKMGYPDLSKAVIVLLNEHSKPGEISSIFSDFPDGCNVGLMSDAGCPGIADPGGEVVALAHRSGIEVEPLTGPSSVMLGIMASGFNSQNFAFCGYLPIEKEQRIKTLKYLESLAVKQKQAQFFIETPYRNQALFTQLTETLSSSTKLFIGKDISGESQLLKTMTVAEWKKCVPDLNKIPALFGIYS
jgi:16S rRNA (cytidine1402-2'-O)-methyltransferase